ncbi:extracellular solute-binding protein [Butyrivibrio sp. AE3006]|uniref:extracellular solute-binding protein n=1 Tax=Butyrivibrio sp. AE3006 TaxID=1280673 RepID=UPI0003F4BF30|nr:extracellular solute-binding protein [Butyrivibrio sp. AE3006]
MKKKLVSVLMATAMTASLLAGCGGAADTAADTAESTADAVEETAEEATEAVEETTEDAAEAVEEATEDVEEATEDVAEAADDTDYGTGEIKIWVADNVVDFTKEQFDKFIEANPQFAGYTATVEAVGEGDAASNMITDVTAGADIYGFAQDQTARLVAAGALEEVAPENVDAIKSENAAGAVTAATVGDTLYSYPETADNGYFLYYDKSVVTDPSTLEGILEQCEAAGKNFYMDLTGWYQVAFFFGTGCTLTYESDNDGNFTACDCNYDSEEGLVALKEMIEVASSKAFQPGSSAGDAVDYAAIIDGTWDADVVKAALGDNYACAKLPTFTGSDGKSYQMSGFNGCKLIGVKPQEDENKLAVCDALAQYLTSEEVQLARYNAVGWGPSNLKAQEDPSVKADEALSALSEQFAFTIPQGQYPGDYWSNAEALAGDVTDKFQSASDDDLKAALATFQETVVGLAQ